MSNTNRDYAIVYDIKNSSLILSRPLVFYITDKNTSNIFIRLVTKTNIGDGVDQYTDIENASSYILIMRVIKPNDEVTNIKATQREPGSIFEFDLTENFKDIPGTYICELMISTIVDSRQELITSDSFTYEVKRSVLSKIDQIIEHEETTVEKLLNELDASKAELSAQVQASDNKIENIKGELSSQIKEIKNRLFYVNVKNFGAKGDGVTNDSESFQKAINYLNNKDDSCYDENYRGGVVVIPPGIYIIDDITLKSNIALMGSGANNTFIKPISTDKNTFKTIATSNNPALNISISDLSIGNNIKPLGHENTIKKNIIELNYVSRSNFYNIRFNDINGSCFCCNEVMDTNFDKIEFINCGNSNNGALNLKNTSTEVSNAIRITNSRFELGGLGLNIENPCELNNNLQCREIYLIGNKFENSDIDIKNGLHINFTSCHFTNNEKINRYMIKVSENTGVSSTNNFGVKFTGCSFTTGANRIIKLLENNSNHFVNFVNCSMQGLYNSDTSVFKGNKLAFSSCNFNECLGVIAEGENINVCSCNLTNCNGDSYNFILTNLGLFIGNIGNTNKCVHLKGSSAAIGNKIYTTTATYYVEGSANKIIDDNIGTILYANETGKLWNYTNRLQTNISRIFKNITSTNGVTPDYGEGASFNKEYGITSLSPNTLRLSIANSQTNEIIKIKIEFVSLNGETKNIEKIFTNTGLGNIYYFLTEEDILSLSIDNSAIDKIKLYSSSNLEGSSAKCSLYLVADCR